MDTSPYDAWADIYDSVFSYVSEDIPFYVDEAVRSGGPVVELGCGTGRVAIPIALSGIDVVGLDSSPLMIERARQKAEQTGVSNLRLVQADMTDFKFDDKFTLAIVPFRGLLALLSLDGLERALLNIRRHLTPGGKLIFDIFVPDLNMMVQEGDVPYHFRDVTDPTTGRRLVIWNQASYDSHSQIMSIRSTIEELDLSGRVASKIYRDFALRYMFRWEMHYLLQACGYDILELYGDFKRQEFDENSTEMVWVATPTG